jgi:hypothetical protein
MRVMKRARVMDFSDLQLSLSIAMPADKLQSRVNALVGKELMRLVKEGCYAYVPN